MTEELQKQYNTACQAKELLDPLVSALRARQIGCTTQISMSEFDEWCIELSVPREVPASKIPQTVLGVKVVRRLFANATAAAADFSFLPDATTLPYFN